ncbi:MAG TPA: YCF48-related protein [Rhodothermales bacterium]|nr:YCF48-related protein [Rhodothermales bacterium]
MVYRYRSFWLVLLGLILADGGWAQAPSDYWNLLPNSPERGRHDDVFFTSDTTGWLVNLSGEIYHTDDGGATWTLQASLGVGFRSVGFANEQMGWVGSLTEGRVLFETRDGGATWTDITHRLGGTVPSGICGLWVVNEQVVYGVGRYSGPPYVIKSTDGGLTWTVRNLTGQIETIVDVFFFDAQRGVIVGGNNSNLEQAQSVVLMTDDGGTTWHQQHLGQATGEWGWKISFPTPMTGYVSVERTRLGARLLKTTNGGATWQELLIENSAPLQGTGFATENLGWVSGRGMTWQTDDGGATWQQIELDGRMNRFRLFGDSLGYAAGSRVYKFNPSMATASEEQPMVPQPFRLQQNYPNPFRGSTTLSYVLSDATDVSLAVYDVLGRHVATLVDEQQPPDIYRVDWDGTTHAGEAVTPGVYIYRLHAGGRTQTGTMVLLRN